MEQPGLGILDEKMKMLKWNGSGGDGWWATVLEMPIDTGGQLWLVEKNLAERLVGGHLYS
jgi:hypothetical protein